MGVLLTIYNTRGYMETLQGLKISLCQMRVVPGRPDINADYVINQIQSASKRGVDIIVFPELAVSGYLIADKFEDLAFIKDVEFFNQKIIASVPDNITAIFGTVVVSQGKGEDGRHRMHNAAIVVQGGKQLGYVVKTLQPHYRYFDDDKHLFSARKIAEEKNCRVKDLLKTYRLETSVGIIPVGISICEDLWKDDYALNPSKILADKGAKLLIALSASPWGWQKNRKRHQVMKKLIEEIKIPIVYVNNTGCQNNGDNIINFDGVSTVYNNNGDIVHETESYFYGTQDITFNDNLRPIQSRPQNDTRELYLGIKTAVKDMLEMLPEPNRHIVIGLSGGVDSATVAALMVDILGPKKVHLINMPYEYNDPAIKNLAQNVADNLGIPLDVRPIKGIVDAVSEQSEVKKGEFAHQNIQARARMEILTTTAQRLGGAFTCNANKVEIAFGYGTLDGDMRGWLIPFGDLVKREVRQLAQYLNSEVFKKEIIPQECIDQIPSAELERNQKDPFDYGYPTRRGYHDEWVRAVTEFRWNPEKFLEMYLDEKLEKELMLEPETLNRLFPTPEKFVEDLERCWRMFCNSFFKRVQAPPIVIVSRRAFGRDLEESMLSVHYTQRYLELKQKLFNS